MEYRHKLLNGKNHIYRFIKRGSRTIGKEHYNKIDLSFNESLYECKLSSVFIVIRYFKENIGVARICQFGVDRDELVQIRDKINNIIDHWGKSEGE